MGSSISKQDDHTRPFWTGKDAAAPSAAANFNKLTPAEAERLAILAEEAGEVVQAVGKILRHGYGSYNPDAPDEGNNCTMLEREIADLYGAVNRMVGAGDIDAGNIERRREASLKRRLTGAGKTYTHHQGDLT